MRSFRIAFGLILVLVPLAFGWFQIYRSSQAEKPVPPSAETSSPQAEPTPGHPSSSPLEEPKQKPLVTVEIYIPPSDLPINLLFRPVLARLDALEQEFPQTLRVIRHDLDDPATLQAMQGDSKLWGVTLVNGQDVHFLQEGNRKRQVVLRIKSGGLLGYTPDDLEAVIRQALQRNAAAASHAPKSPQRTD